MGFYKIKGGGRKVLMMMKMKMIFIIIMILMMIVMMVMRGRRREVFHQKALSPPLAANLSFCSHTSSFFYFQFYNSCGGRWCSEHCFVLLLFYYQQCSWRSELYHFTCTSKKKCAYFMMAVLDLVGISCKHIFTFLCCTRLCIDIQ